MPQQYSIQQLAPEYLKLWNGLKLTKPSEAEQAAKVIFKGKSTYTAVQWRTGVPWFVIGLMHYRESKCDFNRWLHNGDPMRSKSGQALQTTHKPAHRPPDPSVSWEDGAVDALVVCERLDLIKQWGPEHVAYASEKFNGFGYRHPDKGIPSPYLWGGTNRQKRGKYVRDGVYDATVMDPQLGTMAVLKDVMVLDPEAAFTSAPEVAPEPSQEPPRSPKALDPTDTQVKPLRRSNTLWGGLITWFGGVWGSLAGMWEHIATPWGFAALALLILAISAGLYLVIKGRIDVQKVVEHLSPAPDEEEQATA